MKSKHANNGTCSETKRATQLRYQNKKFYGLTTEQANELRATSSCEICGSKAKRMVIDHDHSMLGTYRGLLCNQCNPRLGWLEKHKDVIEEYLKRGPQNAIN